MLFSRAFHAPRTGFAQGLALRMLSPDHALADYEAVGESADRIRGVFGPNNDWPPPDLTFEANRADLARHWAESQANQSFAYSVWRGDAYAGCVYIKPFKSRLAHDARRARFKELCFLWVTNDAVADEAAILGACKHWIAEAFPLQAPMWPGRDLSWAAWEALA
jgi:hypothetical protein